MFMIAIARCCPESVDSTIDSGITSYTYCSFWQVEAATIIVLEYSTFLPYKSKGSELVESAVDYYLKSPMVVTVAKVAKEICRQDHHGEELGKKILEFILENRLCSTVIPKVSFYTFEHPAASMFSLTLYVQSDETERRKYSFVHPVRKLVPGPGLAIEKLGARQ
ncbi:uncharacterized protein F5147DRAFT_656206 [Suillus discolor]|uniref:Uncharacterized protein n=1 Tax=Suillus discolor TaxID=1912936 RepID=A0A9P7F0C4_9AGAM|nr:uncharacterized protein F5147DRAFT_656206 [Suillus discolor]KAG2097966.1 hypothetical protein F5147DRAFT_656206 [Suillus discolor]